jgi:hypothetical protein
VTPVDTVPLALAKDIGPIVVLVDRLPNKVEFAEALAEQVSIGLRQFSARSSWAYVDAADIEEVRTAGAVVYLGINGYDPLSDSALARLREARQLIVSQYHLSRLREVGIAFANTTGGKDIAAPANTTVRYKEQTFRTDQPDFLDFEVRTPARMLGAYNVSLPGKNSLPYIVQDGHALFINGDFSFDSDDDRRRGRTLAIFDAMTEFLGVQSPSRPLAMLRLEDVSALTPTSRLESIVDYLADAHVPYGIGVIPDLHVQGNPMKVVSPLREHADLLRVIRWSQEHGGVVILHGLHHCCSSEGAEGYEFWDQAHQAPVANDSPEWMRAQVKTGLDYVTGLGLTPQMWETPHYSASPADYRVVSEFFTAAWEVRDPIGWLPWLLRRDQYGIMLLPENLGYVSLDGNETVADQLALAKELLVCRNCIAAGFLHPSTVKIEDVRAYVEGLRNLGYAFVDPAQVIRLTISCGTVARAR